MSARILLRARLALRLTLAPRTRMLIASLACTACSWGVKASDIPWTLGPEGAPATVRLMNGGVPLQGELLTVDTAGVLLRTSVISQIRWNAVRSLGVRKLGRDYAVSAGARPSIATIGRLALISHFPQGVSPELLAKLLEATKQSALEEIR